MVCWFSFLCLAFTTPLSLMPTLISAPLLIEFQIHSRQLARCPTCHIRGNLRLLLTSFKTQCLTVCLYFREMRLDRMLSYLLYETETLFWILHILPASVFFWRWKEPLKTVFIYYHMLVWRWILFSTEDRLFLLCSLLHVLNIAPEDLTVVFCFVYIVFSAPVMHNSSAQSTKSKYIYCVCVCVCIYVYIYIYIYIYIYNTNC